MPALGRRMGDERLRLRALLLLLFVAIATPSAVLVHKGYEQMRIEAFLEHRLQAEALSARIDERLAALVSVEEKRSFADYDFLIVSGDAVSNFVRPSVLSEFPVSSGFPGLIGHFQVDADGEFATPLLPDSPDEALRFGIGEEEYRARLAHSRRLHALLSAQQLVRERNAPAEPARDGRLGVSAGVGAELEKAAEEQSLADAVVAPSTDTAAREYGEEAFRQLQQAVPAAPSADGAVLRRLDEIELDTDYAAADELTERGIALRSERTVRAKRKEQVALPSAVSPSTMQFQAVPISTFAIEVEPFNLALLDERHLVLFRRVFREGDRFVQGAVIELHTFLAALIQSEFRATSLARTSDLTVGFYGQVRGRSGDAAGSLLYRARLSPPFEGVELVFSVASLPIGPGGRTLAWSALVLLVVLVAGFALLYRLGIGQIRLHRQQQDFVAAVSHELKTPLTSIRMYGEMLREGWVQEEKRQVYYDFIFHESERLSRLIANVLELARLTRNHVTLDLRTVRVAEVLAAIRPKILSQIEHAGFELCERHGEDALTCELEVDPDALTQVVINLVDNALKFSAGVDESRVEWRAERHGSGELVLSVRDFGPGVPRSQLKKIFRLFYRSGSELTRETVGTGIGLALVNELVSAMHGRVDVVNRDPGAEFRVFLPTRGVAQLTASA